MRIGTKEGITDDYAACKATPELHPIWESFERRVAPTAVGVIPNDFYGLGMTGRILLGQFMEAGVRQFTLDAAPMRLVTAHGFFLNDIAAIVDMQFDASGRLYMLTISALYWVDSDTF